MTVTDSVISGNDSLGLQVFATGNVALVRSVVSRNLNTGVSVSGVATLDSSIVRGNTSYGLYVDTSAKVYMSNMTVDSNAGAGVGNSGTVYTRQNNTVEGNAVNYSGTGALNNITAF